MVTNPSDGTAIRRVDITFVYKGWLLRDGPWLEFASMLQPTRTSLSIDLVAGMRLHALPCCLIALALLPVVAHAEPPRSFGGGGGGAAMRRGGPAGGDADARRQEMQRLMEQRAERRRALEQQAQEQRLQEQRALAQRAAEREPVVVSIEQRTTVSGQTLPDGTPNPNEVQVTRETTIRWLRRANASDVASPDRAPPPVRLSPEERRRLRADIREAGHQIYPLAGGRRMPPGTGLGFAPAAPNAPAAAPAAAPTDGQ